MSQTDRKVVQYLGRNKLLHGKYVWQDPEIYQEVQLLESEDGKTIFLCLDHLKEIKQPKNITEIHQVELANPDKSSDGKLIKHTTEKPKKAAATPKNKPPEKGRAAAPEKAPESPSSYSYDSQEGEPEELARSSKTWPEPQTQKPYCKIESAAAAPEERRGTAPAAAAAAHRRRSDRNSSRSRHHHRCGRRRSDRNRCCGRRRRCRSRSERSRSRRRCSDQGRRRSRNRKSRQSQQAQPQKSRLFPPAAPPPAQHHRGRPQRPSAPTEGTRPKSRPQAAATWGQR